MSGVVWQSLCRGRSTAPLFVFYWASMCCSLHMPENQPEVLGEQCGAGSVRFSSPADEEPGNCPDTNPMIQSKHMQAAAQSIFGTIESHVPDFLTPAIAELTN